MKDLISQKASKHFDLKILLLSVFVLTLCMVGYPLLKNSSAIQVTPPISEAAIDSKSELFELLTICVQPDHGLEQGCLIAQLNTTPQEINGPQFIGPFFENFDWAFFSQNMNDPEKCALVGFFEDWFQVDNLSDYGIDENC